MQNTLNISNVTGVDVALRIAGPGARCYAFVVDWHIRLVLAMAWFVLASLAYQGTLELVDSDTPAFSGYFFLVLLPAVAVYALYHLVLEVVMQGRTPGKRIAGVRVVTMQAQIPGVMPLLIRNVLRLIDSLPTGYVVGLIAAMLTKHSVRIGDLAAGTVLVYENGDQQNQHDAPGSNLPNNLQYGALGGTDQFGVDAEGIALTELVQDLLLRWDQLEDDKRCRLATKLLAKVSPELSGSEDPATLKQHLERALETFS